MYSIIDDLPHFFAHNLQKSLSYLCLLGLLFSPVSAFYSVPAAAQSGQMVQVRIVVEKVVGLGKKGAPPLSDPGGPDFFARITLDNVKFTMRKVEDRNDPSPNWSALWLVDRSQKSSVPIKIELFESDWASESRVDINPQAAKNLNLVVDLNPCNVHGDKSGSCGIRLDSKGDDVDEKAEILFRVDVFVPTARVVIEKIRALDDGPNGIRGLDVFAKISIDSQVFTFDRVKMEQEVSPNWTAATIVTNPLLTPSVLINIELFYRFCLIDDSGKLVCSEAPVDINPTIAKNFTFQLDLSPCFIRGDAITASCSNTSWILNGNEGRRAEIQFRVESLVAPPIDLPDVVVTGMEVTQGIQDLNNSVRLVEGKPTFVRLHVFSTNGNHSTQARLRVTNVVSGNFKVITSSASVTTNPNRGNLFNSFLFQIPATMTQLTSGFVSLTAEVNLDSNPLVRNPIENNYNNNTISKVVVFESVPALDLVLYSIEYGNRLSPTRPSLAAFTELRNWLTSAYPISDLDITQNTLYVGTQTPVVQDVNDQLIQWWYLNRHDKFSPNRRYYGIAVDLQETQEQVKKGITLLGRANDIPGLVATGTTQVGPSNGGHEMGHVYGRYHAEYCSADGGSDYPYKDGRISDTFTGDNAFYGFQVNNSGFGLSYNIPDPTHYDLMSYCEPKWISDFTYEGMMNYFQENFARSLIAANMEAMTRILFVGHLDLSTQQVKLQPLYIIPNAFAIAESNRGDYAIVLRSQDHIEMLRNTFTPNEVTDTTNLLSFAEFVPYVHGTKYIEIVGPQGILHTITATASLPTITLLFPNGGETITDNPTVSWTANDPDDDALTFMVQYSADDGQSWEVVASNITETSVPIDAINLPAGDKARFRVWVTDGFNTASDESNVPFTIPNHIPTINIISPISGTIISTQQTLALQGDAYDIDLGSMPDEMLRWLSDRDGLLANGDQSSVTALSPGQHRITFQANDGADAIVTDTVQITVVADPSQLPTPPDELVVSSNTLALEPDAGIPMRSVYLDNANLHRSLDWQAVSNQSWLKLDTDAGTTPDHLTVEFAGTDLPSGLYTATVTLTSTHTPGKVALVEAQAIRLADVAVAQVQAPASIIANQPLTYTVVITNGGPATAQSVTVIDTLPRELTFDPTTSTPGCSANLRIVTCAITQLSVGSQTTLQIATKVTTNITTSRSITNFIEVSVDSFDANFANNIKPAPTTLQPVPTADSETQEPVLPTNQRIYLPLVQR